MSNIQIFKSFDGSLELKVPIDKETAWLSQTQMVELFGRDKSVISRHIANIFNEGELAKDSVIAKNATTALDGKIYQVEYYNLDVVISVGYRVKSHRGVQFRQWATSILKHHLVEGYTLNQLRLQERGIEFKEVLSLLSQTLTQQHLVSDLGTEVLKVISDYARSWTLLQRYDEQTLKEITNRNQTIHSLSVQTVLPAIQELKQELIRKEEASELFGQIRGEGLYSAISTIEQTFDGEPLYPNVANRAAHLLYFVIKNHPLVDGNKRVGSFLFLWYLRLNETLLARPVEGLINDNTLVALALLVAESLPKQKELIIRLIENFILLK